MGQALDKDNEVLGEAFGKFKKEIFDELNVKFPDAEKILIQKIHDKNEHLKTRLKDYSKSGEQIFIDCLNRIEELERQIK